MENSIQLILLLYMKHFSLLALLKLINNPVLHLAIVALDRVSKDLYNLKTENVYYEFTTRYYHFICKLFQTRKYIL